MKEYLKDGTELQLKGIDGTYIIREVVGRGSSCVVYRADFINEIGVKSEHLLKEFNPKNINIGRNDDLSLRISDEELENFEEAKERFREGFKNQLSFREKKGLKNYTANIQNVYEDYNTLYIDMNVTEGISYDLVEEKSIYNLARRMKVLAQIVEKYHEHGYLHLDLKPSNIYVRPENETCEDMLLFDFDSMVKKSELQDMGSISYTNGWAALELTSASRRNSVCEATDIFAIGEIFFEKLMGRHSEPWERRSFSKYVYDFERPIFENVNPRVTALLNDLFRCTLCNSVSARYQAMSELVKALDQVIYFTGKGVPCSVENLHNKCVGISVGFNTELLEKNIDNVRCKTIDEYWNEMENRLEVVIKETFNVNSDMVKQFIADYEKVFVNIRKELEQILEKGAASRGISNLVTNESQHFVECMKRLIHFEQKEYISIDIEDEEPKTCIVCLDWPLVGPGYQIPSSVKMDIMRQIKPMLLVVEKTVHREYIDRINRMFEMVFELFKNTNGEIKKDLYNKAMIFLNSERAELRKEGLKMLFRDWEEQENRVTLEEINRQLPLCNAEILSYVNFKILFLRKQYDSGELLFGVKDLDDNENIIFSLETESLINMVLYKVAKYGNKVYILIQDDIKLVLYVYNAIDDSLEYVTSNVLTSQYESMWIPSACGELWLQIEGNDVIKYGKTSYFDEADSSCYTYLSI